MAPPLRFRELLRAAVWKEVIGFFRRKVVAWRDSVGLILLSLPEQGSLLSSVFCMLRYGNEYITKRADPIESELIEFLTAQQSPHGFPG
jgi:hypothetical protein